jgi:tetratricopeptide (TPR) repeat protein
MKRIFVSATTRDLESYRLLASQSLRKRGFEVDDQAIFNLTYLEIAEKLEQRIAACDAVVCLIGFVYGGEPSNRPADQPRRSYTQWEYFLARKLNKPVYLMLADEKVTFDPHDPESEELRQLQEQYRAEITRNRDWRSFANADQLRAELAELRFPWEGPPPDHKPCNLPLVTLGTLFKGRDEFLDDLRARLGVPNGRATAIVSRQAVHGLGGVGKTRAAVEYAWRHAGDYTALLFISAPTAAELRANLADLVGVLGMKVDGLPIDQQMAEVLHWLDAHPGWLLIVDNVDTDEAAREVERLLASLRAGHVLITSRIANWSAGVEPLELHVLAPDAAVAFLLERTPHRRQSADDASRAAAIAHELDGLALALEQAGAYINKLRLSFVEYLERWEAKRPEALRWHDLRLMRYPTSVAITWETTFAQLTEPEQRLLEVLAWLAPEPIPLFLFDGAPLTEAIPDPREALAGLMGYSLARFDATGTAVLVHRLVQEIIRERRGATEPSAGLETALNAVNQVAPFASDDVRTWPIWSPLASHAAAVARHADAAGLTTPTSRLMNRLGMYLDTRCQFQEAERLYRRALAIDETSNGPNHRIVALHLNNLALLLKATNRLTEAEPIYRRALAIDESFYGPDHPEVATDLNNLAGLLFATNRMSQAEPLYRRALAIDESFYGPNHPEVATALNNLAGLLHATNRMNEAEPLYRRALAIDEASHGSGHPRVAIDLNNLAELLRATNRMNEAEPLYRHALAIDEASYGPDHSDVAIRLNNLAELLRTTNRLTEAEPLYRRALAIDEASYGLDHPIVAIHFNNLALLLKATNRLAEAEPLCRRALEIFLQFTRATGHEHPHLRSAFVNSARLLAAMGQTPEQILARLDEIGRPFGISLGDLLTKNAE